MSLVGLKGMSRERLVGLLDAAQSFLDASGKPRTPAWAQNLLADRAVGLLFFEPSTRTRVSFELAAKRLGATVINLNAYESSLKKGETVLDTVLNLEAMGMDVFVVRHGQRGIPAELDAGVRAPIVNAGDGTGEHPTQGLLDTLVLRRRLSDLGGAELAGRTITYIGDIKHSRVVRSGANALRTLGATVRLAGPDALLPEDASGWGGAEIVRGGRAEALRGADAVIVLRIQRERFPAGQLDEGGYGQGWRITREALEAEAKPDVWVLHPGPVIRGEEMEGEVADGDRSLILEQVSAGVAVRQAVLLDVLKVGVSWRQAMSRDA